MVIDATWYSCNVGVISRSKTRTAIGAAAYITGTCLYDREREASPNYEPSDYRRKGGVEQWFITAPEQAPEWTYDIESLCNEAQARDTRINSCTARVGRVSLPDSADAEGREEIAHEIAGHLAGRYQVAVIAGIHAPDRHGDDRNWHMHFWFTTREMDENGLGAKTRVLDDKKTGSQEIIHIRGAVADIINRYLDDAGIDERVDHRSYEDRGIERIPTIHLGSAASALERKGIRTERGDINRAIRESNRKLDRLVSELGGVQAEITLELEREFTDRETEPEQEIKSSFPAARIEEPEPPPLQEAPQSWQKQKEAAQSAFDSEVTASFQSEIEGQGEIREYGLGKNWFDRTLTMFENLYYDTIEQVKDFWREYIVNRNREDRDDPDREDRDR